MRDRPISIRSAMAIWLVATSSPVASADDAAVTTAEDVSEITVRATRIANDRPAGSYASPATALRFDPQTDLQPRGMPEGQADVSVRGGLFENTGFQLGAVTVMDPQTGHYAAGLPIDQAFLTAPEVLTGIDNALRGFNSSVATVAYGFPEATDQGALALGAGSDGLDFQSLRLVGTRKSRQGRRLALAVSSASSQGDGSLPNGDHDFARHNLWLQHSAAGAQTDFMLGYEDKFYAWPGAYTGIAALPETDHTRTALILASHRRRLEQGWFEATAVHRRLEDDYDFDRRTRESGTPGSFDHETVISAVGFQGLHRRRQIDWRYGAQFTRDELVRSTDLSNGDVNHRRYLKVSVVPSIEIMQAGGRAVTLRAGATYDGSSRDSSAVSPLVGVRVAKSGAGATRFVDLEFAAASQVPGYTALKSPPAGLFGGNSGLGREKSRQWVLSAGHEAGWWDARVALFYRQDDDLVDWTYRQDAPAARQANPVDVALSGAELWFSRHWERLVIAAAHTWLDKNADYRSATVNASYYALNYPRHRATLAAIWRWTERLTWRLDSEYRVQEHNPLRTSDEQALTVSLGLAWEAPDGLGPAVILTADNLTDNDFEPFPGTPAVGRQLSLRFSYGW